jgi:hypothetical protein
VGTWRPSGKSTRSTLLLPNGHAEGGGYLRENNEADG